MAGQLQPGSQQIYVWDRIWSCFNTRTAPQKNKLIVVVPLILNLHLKLEEKVGRFFFTCTLHINQYSPGRVLCPGDQKALRCPTHKIQPSWKILSKRFLAVRSYLKPATQSWSNACSRSVCFRKNLQHIQERSPWFQHKIPRKREEKKVLVELRRCRYCWMLMGIA